MFGSESDDTDGSTDPATENGTGNRLTVAAPGRCRNDQETTVRVTGASAGARVAVSATLVDDEGVEWTAEATFAAAETGVVDLEQDAPTEGTYEGVAPMGWLWSMRSDADARFASLGERPTVTVRLRAETDGDVAEQSHTRVLYDEGATVSAIDRDDLVGRVFRPPGDGPFPGVLNLHGSGGPSSGRFERALADHGFVVCAPRYFGEPEPLPDELGQVPQSYVDRAARWFLDRPAVSGDRLGVVGASRGAELALLTGARYDWPGAVVSYAGSGVAWDTPDGKPAWIADGEPVPHLSGQGPPERTDDGEIVARPVLERGFENATPAERREAAIPVEDIDGPVLLLSGGADRVWPARRLSAVAAERLARDDVPHEFSHLTYDGCGHLIPAPYVPLSGVERGDVTARAAARAGADSWPRVLEYLERGLAD